MTVFDATLAGLSQLLGPGLVLRAVAETGSTNTDLLEACRQAPQAQLLVAERQTAGRGRLGRSWSACAGDSLTFSLAWPWAGSPLDGLSLAVGLALADALDPPGPAGPQLRLKWPNDLWLDGDRKLGGVLIESLSQGGAPVCVVLGVGLNLRAPALDVPTAGLQTLDARWTAPLALAAVVPPLVELLRSWTGWNAAHRQAYAARDALAGRTVAGSGWRGVAEGIGPQGELLLRDAQGQRQAVRAGEVSLRPEDMA